MAIRIYALAKELDITRDDVTDLCDKLKIVANGKSALASMSDQDAERIRKYVLSQKSDSKDRRG